MTKVKLVEQNELVRVVAMSEHAVEKTCGSWLEAVAYCDDLGYTVENSEEALTRLLDTSDVPGDKADEGGHSKPEESGDDEEKTDPNIVDGDANG